jgi:hypothetical protein
MTTSSSETERAVPEMDAWRMQVKAIETPEDMMLFLHDLGDHAADDRGLYCFEDRAGALAAMALGFAGDQSGEHLREVAVALLVALSWDGESIDIE